MSRHHIVMAAAAVLALCFPVSGWCQDASGLIEISVTDRSTVAQPGQRLSGEARRGQALITFHGRAGQVVNFDLQTEARNEVHFWVTPKINPWSFTAPNPVLSMNGRNLTVSTTLPADDEYQIIITENAFLPRAFPYTLTFTEGSAVGTAGTDAPPSSRTAPSAPIIIADGAPHASPGDPAMRMIASALQDQDEDAAPSSGPIIIAANDAPAPVFREAPPTEASATEEPSAPDSREALMQQQVQVRREQVAAQERARVERERAERQAREEAERRRREAERVRQQERDAMWGAVFQGALTIGQAYADAQAEVAQRQNELNRLAAAAAQETRERQEREAAAQRQRDWEHAQRVTQAQLDQRRQYEANDARQQAAARQAEQNRAQQEQEAERRRQEQQRAEAEPRRAAEEAEALRQAEERAAQARAEQQRREAERAAAEAHRNRLVDFPEAVTLCELTGPQAQSGNWTCHGALQTTFAKLDTADAAVPLDQACGGGPVRELGVAAGYRAFGCGFGLHPDGAGAFRHIPERLGVSYVPGRITFRCPISSTNNCRSR